MKLTAKHTIYSCYLGYITQAIVNNLPPLLFLTFHNQFGISLEKISLPITVNFCIQILIDFLAPGIIKKWDTGQWESHPLLSPPLVLQALPGFLSSSQRLHRHPYLYGVQRSGRRYLGGYRKPHCGVLSQ